MQAEVTIIETPGLGDRSYVVSDGSQAALIDPQRDVDRSLAEAERLGVRITDVVETHIQNDYVTGGLAGHLPRAVHIPFYELEDRIGEVPDVPEIWVHCASGFRASVGSSLLDRAGRRC